jgi:hypothetical protein
VHNATLGKINELMKELIRYNEDLHKKHKQIKGTVPLQHPDSYHSHLVPVDPEPDADN